jgi:hypothetical protein
MGIYLLGQPKTEIIQGLRDIRDVKTALEMLCSIRCGRELAQVRLKLLETAETRLAVAFGTCGRSER